MIDYEKLWEEIDNWVQQEHGRKLPYEKSLDELSTEWGVGKRKAERIVQALVESGQLTYRTITALNGKRAAVYAPAEDKKK